MLKNGICLEGRANGEDGITPFRGRRSFAVRTPWHSTSVVSLTLVIHNSAIGISLMDAGGMLYFETRTNEHQLAALAAERRGSGVINVRASFCSTSSALLFICMMVDTHFLPSWPLFLPR